MLLTLLTIPLSEIRSMVMVSSSDTIVSAAATAAIVSVSVQPLLNINKTSFANLSKTPTLPMFDLIAAL